MSGTSLSLHFQLQPLFSGKYLRLSEPLYQTTREALQSQQSRRIHVYRLFSRVFLGLFRRVLARYVLSAVYLGRKAALRGLPAYGQET